MIWATVSPWSCFCWLCRAYPSLAAKNIISLISVLIIWWCPRVECSLVLKTALQKVNQDEKARSQEIPGVTGKFAIWVQNESKANRVLPREHTDHSNHPLPTTQEMTLHMDIIRWSISKSNWWLYSSQPKIEKLYTVSKNKTGSWLWLRSWTPYCQIQT